MLRVNDKIDFIHNRDLYSCNGTRVNRVSVFAFYPVLKIGERLLRYKFIMPWNFH